MSDVLITTKLYIPSARQGIVQRERLKQLITQGVEQKLTLIAAPAGSGKSTLLADWVAQNETVVAWLSLDEEDNDLKRFLTYLIHAIQPHCLAGCGEKMLTALKAPAPASVERLLPLLINDLATIPEKLVIILEDYQVIEQQSVHDALIFLITYLPVAVHLIIATRIDPPFPLAKWRANRDLNEIRVTDLRFTGEEACNMLNAMLPEKLSREEIAVIEARTEGWAVGLQLAGLALKDQADVSQFINQFGGSHRFVIDYLTDEVFKQQPPAVQAFLLASSLLKQFNADLCNAVMARDDSVQMLNLLEAANLFLLALDDNRHWYRYHHLFTDLLRYKLEHSNIFSIGDLRRRAIEWYAANGLIAEALHHAFALQDFDQAAALIAPQTSPMIGRGETQILQRWIERLPEATLKKYPNLAVSLAWLYNLNNQGQPLEPLLQMAEQSLLTGEYDDTTISNIRGNAAMLRAYTALGENQPGEAIGFMEQALALLPEDDDYLRSIAAFTQGVIYKRGGIWESAVPALQDAYESGQVAGNLTLAMGSIIHLIEMWIIQGRLQQAAQLCHQVIRQHQPAPVPNLGFVHTKLAEILYEWNELEAAADHLEQGFAYLEKMFADMGWDRDAAICQMRLKQLQGDSEAAQAALTRAFEISEQMQDQYDKIDLSFWQARLWLLQGNLTTATRWQRDTQAQSDDRPEWVDVTLARVFIAQGEGKLALDLLRSHRETAETNDRHSILIEILVLQAVAYQLEEDAAQACAALMEALSLAEPEGFVRVFVEAGPPIVALLQQVNQQAEAYATQTEFLFSRDYIARLLVAFPERVSPDSPLSEREVEILRLMAAGLKTPEIAAELFLSKNTVKWYLKEIYSKLNVHSRAEALDAGGYLGLLN